jgi:hypothetical protein
MVFPRLFAVLISAWFLILFVGCALKSGVGTETTRVSGAGRQTDSIPQSSRLYGVIEGMAKDCFGDVLPNATLHLNRMPDSIDPKSPIVREMVFFERAGLSSDVRADSVGYFVFSPVDPGMYQVVLDGAFGDAFGEGRCGAKGVDFVRVAADSASIVNVRQIIAALTVIHQAAHWIPLFRPLR